MLINLKPKYKRKKEILILIMVLITSCAFKKEAEKVEIILDSDGDMINDTQEVRNGTNPYVANIPLLIHEIKIEGLNTENIISKKMLSNALKRRGFSFHSQVEINQQNILKIKVTKETFKKDIARKGRRERNWKKIKNLSFILFDEKGKIQKIEKVTSEGIRLNTRTSQGNLALPLSFNKKMEALKDGWTLKVNDYEIPKLKTTYKELMKSIRKRTIPMFVRTPDEFSVFFVSLAKRGRKFKDIISKTFNDEFLLNKQGVARIQDRESNLIYYGRNQELKDMYRVGKWFVLTNLIKHDLSLKKFRKNDFISLSYFRGATLASNIEDITVKNIPYFSTDQTNPSIYLGEVNENSTIKLYLKPLRRWGEAAVISNKFHRWGAIFAEEARCHFSRKTDGGFNLDRKNHERFLSRVIISFNNEKVSVLEILKTEQGKIQKNDNGGIILTLSLYKGRRYQVAKSGKIRVIIELEIIDETKARGVVFSSIRGGWHYGNTCEFFGRFMSYQHKDCKTWVNRHNMPSFLISSNKNNPFNQGFLKGSGCGGFVKTAPDVRYIENFSFEMNSTATSYTD